MVALSSTRATDRAHLQLACQDSDAPDFADSRPAEMWEAAAICSTCPVAQECRNTAQALHQAHAAGDDPYGAIGCWGGWWYEPGKAPRPILGDSIAAAA